MDNILDKLQDLVDDVKKEVNFNQLVKDFQNLSLVKPTLKFFEENQYTKQYYQLIKNADKKNSQQLKLYDKVYLLDYDSRKLIVFGSTGFILFNNLIFSRRIMFSRLLVWWLLMSSLICRENLNFRSYKGFDENSKKI